MKKRSIANQITKTFDLAYFEIDGTALLNLWGGGQGEIDMEQYRLPAEHFSKDNVLRCVNDHGFGCESIAAAVIEVTPVYKAEDGQRQYGDTKTLRAEPIHSDRFLGWSHLRKIGAIE